MVLWKLPSMAVLHVSSGYVLACVLNHVFRLRGIESKAVSALFLPFVREPPFSCNSPLVTGDVIHDVWECWCFVHCCHQYTMCF